MSKRKSKVKKRRSRHGEVEPLRHGFDNTLVLSRDDAVRFWRELNRKPRLTAAQRQLSRIMQGLE